MSAAIAATSPSVDARASKTLGAGAVLTAAALWGTVGPAQVLAATAADPGALGVARLLVGGAALALFVPHLRPWQTVLRSGGWRWILLAAAATGIYQVTFMHAVAELGAALGTVLALGVAPVATGLAARRWTGERLSFGWMIGTAAAAAGCALLLAPGASAGTSLVGIGFALISGTCYGVYTVAAKRFVQSGAPLLPTTAITLLIAGAALTPVIAMHPEHLVAPRTLGLIAWIAVAGTSVAYAAFVLGLRHTTASTAGTLSLAEPLLAAVIGGAVLHEHLTTTAFAGCMVLIAGLATTTLAGTVGRRSSRQ